MSRSKYISLLLCASFFVLIGMEQIGYGYNNPYDYDNYPETRFTTNGGVTKTDVSQLPVTEKIKEYSDVFSRPKGENGFTLEQKLNIFEGVNLKQCNPKTIQDFVDARKGVSPSSNGQSPDYDVICHDVDIQYCSRESGSHNNSCSTYNQNNAPSGCSCTASGCTGTWSNYECHEYTTPITWKSETDNGKKYTYVVEGGSNIFNHRSLKKYNECFEERSTPKASNWNPSPGSSFYVYDRKNLGNFRWDPIEPRCIAASTSALDAASWRGTFKSQPEIETYISGLGPKKNSSPLYFRTDGDAYTGNFKNRNIFPKSLCFDEHSGCTGNSSTQPQSHSNLANRQKSYSYDQYKDEANNENKNTPPHGTVSNRICSSEVSILQTIKRTCEYTSTYYRIRTQSGSYSSYDRNSGVIPASYYQLKNQQSLSATQMTGLVREFYETIAEHLASEGETDFTKYFRSYGSPRWQGGDGKINGGTSEQHIKEMMKYIAENNLAKWEWNTEITESNYFQLYRSIKFTDGTEIYPLVHRSDSSCVYKPEYQPDGNRGPLIDKIKPMVTVKLEGSNNTGTVIDNTKNEMLQYETVKDKTYTQGPGVYSAGSIKFTFSATDPSWADGKNFYQNKRKYNKLTGASHVSVPATTLKKIPGTGIILNQIIDGKEYFQSGSQWIVLSETSEGVTYEQYFSKYNGVSEVGTVSYKITHLTTLDGTPVTPQTKEGILPIVSPNPQRKTDENLDKTSATLERSKSIDIKGEGIYRIQVVVRDFAGNTSISQAYFKIMGDVVTCDSKATFDSGDAYTGTTIVEKRSDNHGKMQGELCARTDPQLNACSPLRCELKGGKEEWSCEENNPVTTDKTSYLVKVGQVCEKKMYTKSEPKCGDTTCKDENGKTIPCPASKTGCTPGQCESLSQANLEGISGIPNAIKGDGTIIGKKPKIYLDKDSKYTSDKNKACHTIDCKIVSTKEAWTYSGSSFPACKTLCGNGTIDPGEECDEGKLNGTPGQCTSSCKKPSSLCGSDSKVPAFNPSNWKKYWHPDTNQNLARTSEGLKKGAGCNKKKVGANNETCGIIKCSPKDGVEVWSCEDNGNSSCTPPTSSSCGTKVTATSNWSSSTSQSIIDFSLDAEIGSQCHPSKYVRECGGSELKCASGKWKCNVTNPTPPSSHLYGSTCTKTFTRKVVDPASCSLGTPTFSTKSYTATGTVGCDGSCEVDDPGYTGISANPCGSTVSYIFNRNPAGLTDIDSYFNRGPGGSMNFLPTIRRDLAGMMNVLCSNNIIDKEEDRRAYCAHASVAGFVAIQDDFVRNANGKIAGLGVAPNRKSTEAYADAYSTHRFQMTFYDKFFNILNSSRGTKIHSINQTGETIALNSITNTGKALATDMSAKGMTSLNLGGVGYDTKFIKSNALTDTGGSILARSYSYTPGIFDIRYDGEICFQKKDGTSSCNIEYSADASKAIVGITHVTKNIELTEGLVNNFITEWERTYMSSNVENPNNLGTYLTNQEKKEIIKQVKEKLNKYKPNVYTLNFQKENDISEPKRDFWHIFTGAIQFADGSNGIDLGSENTVFLKYFRTQEENGSLNNKWAPWSKSNNQIALTVSEFISSLDILRSNRYQITNRGVFSGSALVDNATQGYQNTGTFLAEQVAMESQFGGANQEKDLGIWTKPYVHLKFKGRGGEKTPVYYISAQKNKYDGGLERRQGRLNRIYIGGYKQTQGKEWYVIDRDNAVQATIPTQKYRDTLYKNVAFLTRNRTAKKANDTTNPLESTDIIKGILYVDGDITLDSNNDPSIPTNALAGWNTIIVKNGNVTFDAEYFNSGSTAKPVSIVALADSNNPGKGNIYIRPNVRYINANMYADGSAQSVDASGKPFAKSDSARTKALEKQLVIKGSLFSRNTVGGAVWGGDMKNGKKKYFKPKGIKTVVTHNLDEAIQYDLAFLRMSNKGYDTETKGVNKDKQESVVILMDFDAINTPNNVFSANLR